MRRFLPFMLVLGACSDDPGAPRGTASLTLVNEVVNDNGGSATAADWTLSANGPTPLSGTGVVVSGPGRSAGSYALSASGPSGYTASAWSCTGGTQSGSTITLDAGASAVCTITNDDTPPSLTLVKVVTNDNGGLARPSDFVLTAQGPTSISAPGTAASDGAFHLGTYVLSEAGPSGYSASAWSCTGATVTGGDRITLALGQVATCTITNNDAAISRPVRYVDNPSDYIITTDNAPPGLSNGDIVTFSGGNHGVVGGLVFGTNAFGTIQSAVDAAAAGDLIRVAPGTFAELVTVNKSLVLWGNQFGVDARQRSGTAGETVLTGSSGSTSFNLTASDVTLDGFIVQDATNVNQFGAGILLSAGTAGSAVRNTVIQDNIVGLFVANSSATNWTVIEGNVFRNNDRPGPVSGTGIYTDQFVAGGALTSVLIDNNSFVGHDGNAAIVLASTMAGSQSSVIMSRNLFTDNARTLIAYNLTGSSFTSNEAVNSSAAGSADLRLYNGVSDFTITNNILQGSGADVRALRVSTLDMPGGAASDITFRLNSITGYGNAALELDPAAYTGTFDAESNWWRSATGPTTPGNPGGTGQRIVDPNNQVDFRPYLTSGVDTDPGKRGFQPSAAP